MKHKPFDSIYRPDFEVVEERQGKVHYYPHTEQLPLLWRALDLEFKRALPGHVARVDKRGDGLHKCMLHQAALFFCSSFNKARTDGLCLFALVDAALVAHVTLVQQVTETHPLGRVHRFRFFAENDFVPEIHLSGKRLGFADHVLQRFSSRTSNKVGEDLANFLLTFYGCAFIAMPVGQSRAFILPHFNSLLAFTYTETDDEFFVTTCLTVKEISSLQLQLPPQTFNQHYGKAFTPPKVRNWLPSEEAVDLFKKWQNKTPLGQPPETDYFKNWKHLAMWIVESLKIEGHSPGSRLCFLDNIPGPSTIAIKPGQQERLFDELGAYKKAHPEEDWDAAFAQAAAQTAETPEAHRRRRFK
jgi:hypothetical protein